MTKKSIDKIIAFLKMKEQKDSLEMTVDSLTLLFSIPYEV